MSRALDIQILKDMVKKCPEGKEADLVITLLLLGFNLNCRTYKKVLLEEFKKRQTRLPDWLERKLR